MYLNIRDLEKSYGDLPVLHGINLSLTGGCTYCLMGASGSGKTTLLRILMGLETADGGSVQWDTAAPRFAAVFQENCLCEDFTPIDNVMMAAGKAWTKAQIYAQMSRLLPEDSLSRPVSTLSGGMKRRTAVCRAVLAPSDVIFMDEPFTGLDEDTKKAVISYIKEMTAGKLLLITTHQEEDVALLGAERVTLQRDAAAIPTLTAVP